jgi:hypothetical protein
MSEHVASGLKSRFHFVIILGSLAAIIPSGASAIPAVDNASGVPTNLDCDYFALDESSSYSDSLRALHIDWILRDVSRDQSIVEGIITRIEEPVLDDLTFYREANVVLKKLYKAEMSSLTVRINKVHYGTCELGLQSFFTIARTPNRGADIVGAKRQSLEVGTHFIGIVESNGDGLFGGNPYLEDGCFFSFGVPNSDNYYSDLIPGVVALYNSLAEVR